MLAKLTSKNQLTLPRQAVDAIGRPAYFTIAVENGCLILAPAQPGPADAVRTTLDSLGIEPGDIADAIRWARANPDA